MRNLPDRLRSGEPVYSAWCGIPEPLVTEAVARAGFDAVVLDMQHGFHSTESVLRCIGAAALAGKPVLVRVPVGRFDMASRALDFGAAGVIAPMINTMADAHAFAAAMKYPPLGERSWGPQRAMTLLGPADPQSYLAEANSRTVALAMIETRAALAIAADIVSLDGIDGLFVGPSDFSIGWSGGQAWNPDLSAMMESIRGIAAAAKDAGKAACIYAVEPVAARRFRDMGFGLIALASDTGYITSGAQALLQACR